MKNKWLFLSLLVVLSSGTISVVKANAVQSSGSIKGVVLDKQTKAPLVDVNISVEGTRLGSTTDRNGKFTISKLAPGKYSLLFEFIGYASIKRDNIVINNSETVELQVILIEQRPIP